MNLNKFTEKAQEAVLGAQQLAESLNHPQIEPEHLLVTLVEQSDGVVPSILRKMSVEPKEIAGAARAELARGPQAHGGAAPGISPRMKLVTDLAQAEATRLKDEYVSTEHLFIAIAG
jgi:ATP-dependent Clp protease ATP-binding subunit ClpB